MNNKPAVIDQLANESPLSLLQKIVRMIDRNAPRIDEKGKHHIATLADKADMNVPEEDINYFLNTASEKITDTIVDLVGNVDGDNIILKGAALGLTAGIGAALLPGSPDPFKLVETETAKKKFMTIGIYIIGGIAAAYITQQLNKNKNKVVDYQA